MTPTAERNGVPDWFDDAVLYQVYPQSFADSDGDGIGDFAGITAHLDHLSWLGVDAVWINPCFASPFTDAGYDVADYFSVAPRYGTGEDLAHLVDEARRRGIRILFDLVAGHTSDRHPWFVHSASDPADDRYIWADRPAPGFRPSPGSREGYYKPNFFPSQPALNFGYAHPRENEPWRQPVDAEGPRANRRALAEIMDHWLRLGISGFRVDMAYSLVKDDPGQVETGRLWNELRAGLQAEHPEAVLVSEWGDPATAVGAGFHADFLLHFGGPWRGAALRSLWDTRSGTDRGHWDFRGSRCYFDAEGGGSPRTFLDAWRSASAAVEGRGRISLPTSNHDFSRLVCGPRTGAGPAGLRVPAHLAGAARDPLRRRDRHALRPGPAGQGGQRDRPRGEPGRIAHPDAVGRHPGRGILHRRRGPVLPAARPRPRAPGRRLAAGRRAVAAAPGAPADRAPQGPRRAGHRRRGGGRRGRLSAGVRAGRPLPGRGQPRRDAAEVAVAGYGGARPLLTEGAECTASGIRVRGFGFGVFEL
ncbi:alpha-amylase family glycosyl hydrolase [Nocardiopsis composta]